MRSLDLARTASRFSAVLGLARKAPTFAAALALLAAAAPSTRLSAQTLCLNGSPPPKCSNFLIVEMAGVLPVAQTTRTITYPGYPSIDVNAFDERLQWELGAMRNLNARWAVGGSARLGTGSSGALVGLEARARRRFDPLFSLDMSGGIGYVVANAGPRRVAPVVDARVNFRDDFFVGLRYEQAPLSRSFQPGIYDDPGGRQHAVSLLLGTGSEWTLGGTALLAAGIALLLATVDFS